MQAWRWKKQSGPGDAGWRLRRAERFNGATVRCELGTITDISGSGMRVACEGKPPVSVGGVMPVRLKFGDGALTLKAQVRWCKRRGLKRHEVGLNFVDLKPGMPKVLEAIARFGVAAAAKGMDDSTSDPPPYKQGSDPCPPPIAVDLPNYFRVLGVDPGASDAEIKARYRKLAVSCHPDRNDAPDAMQRFEAINEAYHVLSDPQRREAYLRMAG